MDANGSNPTRLTTDPAADRDPAWSPDGSAARIRERSRRERRPVEDERGRFRSGAPHDRSRDRRRSGVVARRHEDCLLQRSRELRLRRPGELPRLRAEADVPDLHDRPGRRQRDTRHVYAAVLLLRPRGDRPRRPRLVARRRSTCVRGIRVRQLRLRDVHRQHPDDGLGFRLLRARLQQPNRPSPGRTCLVAGRTGDRVPFEPGIEGLRTWRRNPHDHVVLLHRAELAADPHQLLCPSEGRKSHVSVAGAGLCAVRRPQPPAWRPALVPVVHPADSYVDRAHARLARREWPPGQRRRLCRPDHEGRQPRHTAATSPM